MLPISRLLTLLPLLAVSHAASADEWRYRSIYQLITDRFAPPADDTTCALGSTTYCGGTWQTIISKLDYIQGMGFDAIWISPTALNLEGTTEYGEAYHGYWTADPTQLNPHFGAESDLKALSDELHTRGMFLMSDVAINALSATSYSLDSTVLTEADNGTLLFQDPDNYHTRCDISWGNRTSEQICWLAEGDDDNGVALMDLKTEDDSVASVLKDWISSYVSDYGIDGLRIDASKHMAKDFQNDLCTAAGSFCMGEVAGDDTAYAASFQGSDGLDSVCGFGMMYGFVAVFTNGDTMSTLDYYIGLAADSYSDPTVIGTFLDNQDLPRFNSLTSDASLVYNAIVGSFMYGGMPIVYYGLEQDVSDGASDPDNREALWNYNDYATDGTTYERIANLNSIRSGLGSAGEFLNVVGETLSYQDNDIAILRDSALIVLTNRGASGSGTWTIDKTGFNSSATVIDLLSCTTSTTDDSGSLTVTWTSGQPFIYVTSNVAGQAGLCGAIDLNSSSTSGASVASSTVTSSLAAETGDDSSSVTSSRTSSTAYASVSGTASISTSAIVDVDDLDSATSSTADESSSTSLFTDEFAAASASTSTELSASSTSAASSALASSCKRSRKRGLEMH